MLRSDDVVFQPVLLLLLGLLWLIVADADQSSVVMNENNKMLEYSRTRKTEDKGTRWAVLVAGSQGYENYRHQADVCHAYQILKKGGLKDENIIVFMYDDIAFNSENPRKGTIINKPGGPDVYAGVPKDYTKRHTTAENLYAVLLGNKSALTGGSGKVLNSGPNDHIFIYYTDHGSPGILGMPVGDYVYAKDLIRVLKKKHDTGSYKSMVIYLEACEAGSMFEGILPTNINIYTTTASNAKESSYGTYCSDEEFSTCLGDLYSVSWMEDCDAKDMSKETLKQQYDVVKKRTTNSHVMQYGYTSLNKEFLSTFMGINPNYKKPQVASNEEVNSTWPTFKVVGQRDVDLAYLQKMYARYPPGTSKRIEAQKRLVDEAARRKQEEIRMKGIAKIVMGNDIQKINRVMESVRPDGQPLVDDWKCFKMLVNSYEQHCGRLSNYGRKYSRMMANMCNAGVNSDQMVRASMQACSTSTATTTST